MSVNCGRTSLTGLPCTKPAKHEGNHRHAEGKEWPEGQSWSDLAAEYFRSLDKIHPSELSGNWTPDA